ncbi:lysophospholipid acyltransferase family protein [Pelagovum pacificum]|uniref:DUF374 domain-containing protein n=1 Tax=Pelagovum pacificum TaxID=2588711 RepID=A0A5C5GBM1_9RHOB|nr:DUF374 domain-containing protein [Pelagovum pacificum]QQA42288.1 DUF374 domain-containing protein [Pelagovum pacificum]TNY31372.1 DUF374 domain-containing protein [Pelagovum pacificum]
MTFRKELKPVNLLARLLGGAVALWGRFCLATSRWTAEGEAELQGVLAEGPAIVVMWHSRILLGPAFLMRQGAPFIAIRDPSPAGRLGGAVQASFGMEPVPMSTRRPSRAATRTVIQGVRSGKSLGIATDGPEGPAHQSKSAAIDWARASGATIVLFAFSTRRQVRLGTWDRMLLPLPFTRGVYGFRTWRQEITRQSDREVLLAELDAAITAHQHEIDVKAGVPAGP